MTMKELAERCEKATGPDEALDGAIWLAVKADANSRKAYDEGLKLSRQEAAFRLSYMSDGFRPTASLDAAMTLVPEGWAARVENWPRPHGQADMAHDGGPKAKAVLMECLMIRIGKRDVWGFHTPGSASVETRAATPALALCAAALKVRASRETTR